MLQGTDIDGRTVYTADGEKVGKVDEVYCENTGATEWLVIKKGLLSGKRLLVPAQGAELSGDDIRLAYTQAQIDGAPDIDDTRFESDDDEEKVYTHYGMEYPGRSFGYADASDYRRHDWDVDRSADKSVTSHEEQLAVGKETVNAGTVRLHKWVENKPVSETVNLRRDTAEVRVEPINERVDNANFGEDEVEVNLTREEAVVSKQTIAKERVSLEADTEQVQEQVTDTVREEHVEVEGAGATTRR